MKFILSLAPILCLCFALPAAAQNKTRLNWGAVSGVMSPIWVAQEEGLFKKHGLDIELIHIASTSKAIQSMLSGEIQFTTADALNSIQAVAAGADVVMVCEGVNRFVFSLMARPELRRVADLKGKKSASRASVRRPTPRCFTSPPKRVSVPTITLCSSSARCRTFSPRF